MMKLPNIKSLVLALDREQAQAVLESLVEALDANDVKSVMILSHQEELGEELPNPDIIIIGSVTVLGVPTSLDEIAAQLELNLNPTRN